jgi:hypothetical protein
MGRGSLKLLSSVFAGLESDRVEYVVGRNFEGYPAHVTGDVDIFVDPRSLFVASEVVRLALVNEGWQIFRRARRPFMHSFAAVRPSQERTLIAFDLFASFTWFGFEFMDFKSVYSRRVRRDGFWGAAPEDSALSTLLHYLLYLGDLPHKYRSLVVSHASSLFDNAACDQFLSGPTRNRIKGAVKDELWEQLATIQRRAQRDLTLANLKDRGWGDCLLSTMSLLWSYSGDVRRPPGVAVIAPVSHSSSVVEEVLEYIRQMHAFTSASRLVDDRGLSWTSFRTAWWTAAREGFALIPGDNHRNPQAVVRALRRLAVPVVDLRPDRLSGAGSFGAAHSSKGLSSHEIVDLAAVALAERHLGAKT